LECLECLKYLKYLKYLKSKISNNYIRLIKWVLTGRASTRVC
jgi:hypothetical protein